MSGFYVRQAETVACRGWPAFGQAYAQAYGFAVIWRTPVDGGVPDLLVWETWNGAQKFAEMNGGTVTEFLTDPSGCLRMHTHGPLQHSPDEARAALPLDGRAGQNGPE